jgi:hypothetical protein
VTELTAPASITIPALLAQQVADLQYDWNLPEADLRALILTGRPISEMTLEELLVGHIPPASVPEGLRNDVQLRNDEIAAELLTRGIAYTVELAA